MAAYFGDTLPRTLKAAPYGVVFFVCYKDYALHPSQAKFARTHRAIYRPSFEKAHL